MKDSASFESWLRSDAAAASEPAPPPLADGAAFGSFRILGLLGRGGFSDVYRAHQEPAGVVGALKILRDTAGSGRFARGVRFLAEHPHPALPRYLGSGETDGHAWIFLEELSPAPLPRSDRAVARLLVALGRGLSHLHALGFVHRDVKPDNILARPDGSPVLIDLGLLKAFQSGADSATAAAPMPPGPSLVGVGTPGWSAPEQFDRGEATPASDVHALGVLADACFGGHPPRAYRPIIRRATSSLPGERYPDAAAFVRAVRCRHATRWMAAGVMLAVAIWIGCRNLGDTVSRGGLTPIKADSRPQRADVQLEPKSRTTPETAASSFKTKEAAREERWAPFWKNFRAWCAANGSPLADCESGVGRAGNQMQLAQGRGFHVQFSISDAGRLQLEIYASVDEAESSGTSPQAVMERIHAGRERIEAGFGDLDTLKIGWFAGKASARSRVTRFVRPGTIDPARPDTATIARAAADGEALLAALHDLGELP